MTDPDRPRRILIVEDNPLDLELVLRELARSALPFTHQCVMSERDYVRALQEFQPDLILSDHSLPTFSASDAVRIARAERPDTPIIIVTGSLDDETAVEYLKAGASDYILKHKLLRLGPAASRVLELQRAQAEERQAQEAKRKSDEVLSAIVEAAPLAIFSVDSEGIVRSWNGAAERMFGWTAAEIVGGPLRTVRDDQQMEHQSLVQRVLQGETLDGLEITRRHKEGRQVDLRLYAAPLHDAAGRTTGIMAMAADITELKRLEAQYRQAQKMEAVGRLAGGVAHDFNNLLTVILAESELAIPDLAPGHPVIASLEQIRAAGEQATSLTRQLLAFSRQQVVEPTVFIMNDLVGEMEKMLKRLIGEDVKLLARLSADRGAVKADRSQIQQVLANLAVNARDAMPDGGILTIETSNVVLDEEYVRLRPDARTGEYVCLAVSDSGIGMTEELITRIFEPFFTTKELGRGTGLGLATCYGIVQQADGHIAVYSEPGIGTTMRVYLPLIRERVSAPAHRASAPLPSGGETVLVVEDQDAVRDVAVRVLRAQGYRVLAAAEAQEALRLLRSTDIDLLITDVVLPGMKGGLLAEKARELRPRLKLLFASGYTGELVAFHQLAHQDVALIQKPFTAKLLSEKVREVLDSG